MDEGFCRPARKKIAGILDILQDFLTWQEGKRPGQTAFHACEYRFLHFGRLGPVSGQPFWCWRQQ